MPTADSSRYTPALTHDLDLWQVTSGEDLRSASSQIQGRAQALSSWSRSGALVNLLLDIHVLEDEMVRRLTPTMP